GRPEERAVRMANDTPSEELMNKPGKLCTAVAAAAATTVLTLPGVATAAMSPSDPTTTSANDSQAGNLPDHLLEGYWQNFTNDAPEMTLADVPEDYDIVAVAFGTATTTAGEVEVGVDDELSDALGGYSDDDLKSDVATLHDRDQRVILSVGGQDG